MTLAIHSSWDPLYGLQIDSRGLVSYGLLRQMTSSLLTSDDPLRRLDATLAVDLFVQRNRQVNQKQAQ